MKAQQLSDVIRPSLLLYFLLRSSARVGCPEVTVGLLDMDDDSTLLCVNPDKFSGPSATIEGYGEANHSHEAGPYDTGYQQVACSDIHIPYTGV